MSEAILSSSPTKTLSTWWKSFKQKESDDDSVPSLQRPSLNRASVSSSALPRVSRSRVDDSAKTHGIDIPPQYYDSPIFGVPLAASLRYASVNISLMDHDGQSFIYGHVPIIVAKCAVFLKQGARETEGIFRLPGSVRRIKVLQELFNTPPSFGKDLDWQGFTVHDAANLLKRYLTTLPESIIPRRFYSEFREPLQTQFTGIRDYMNFHAVTGPSSPSHQNVDASEPPPEPTQSDVSAATKTYEDLIFRLPQASLQLLVYLLDLLSMFAAQSDTNRMPAYNLAAIFQPSILALPEHQMDPDEYQTSRLVIQFLINHSLSILQRVEAKAIEDHTNKKAQAESAPLDSDKSPERGFMIPQLNVQSADSHQEVKESSDGERALATTQILPAPQLNVEAADGRQPSRTGSENIYSVASDQDSTHSAHRRQHSKSLSSAQPPNLEQNKFPGFLRRQRSQRSTLSSSPGADAEGESKGSTDEPPHRQSTRSPPIEEEDRKSRFRRSLMVLLPSRDDHQASRTTSPHATKPELNRSPSWFARLSSNNSSNPSNNLSRSATPEE